MQKLASLVLVASLAACRDDTSALERKIDDLAKSQQKMMELIAKGNNVAGIEPQRPQRAEPDPAKTYAVPIDGNAVEGPADAKVTLVKIFDYACPFCEHVRPAIEELRTQYGKDLRVVSKHLVIHPKQSFASALAFCAANEQGKAKEMDAMIWDKGFKARQLDLTEIPSLEGNAQLAKCWEASTGCQYVNGYAKELGLDFAKFRADMRGKCQQQVQQDMRQLQTLGVGATPSFFINGRFLTGERTTAELRAIIDEELAKANQRISAGTPAAAYYQQWVVEKGQKSVGG